MDDALLAVVTKNARLMFVHRGYSDIRSNNEDTVHAMSDEGLVVLYVARHQLKLNIDSTRAYYAQLRQDDAVRGILVYWKEVTSTTRKLLRATDVPIELFSASQLSFVPLYHRLVPLHTKVPAAGHPQRAQYPRLLASDPVARWLGLQKDDIVRIDRADGGVYYRRVIGSAHAKKLY